MGIVTIWFTHIIFDMGASLNKRISHSGQNQTNWTSQMESQQFYISINYQRLRVKLFELMTG